MGWRHPFTRCSPLKTSAFYWSVANSVAKFVYAIQGAADLPSPLRGPVKPQRLAVPVRPPPLGDVRWYPQSHQRGAQRAVNVTDTGIGKGLQVLDHARREHLPHIGRELRQRVAEKRLLVPPAGSRRLLHRVLRQLDPPLAAKEPQQHGNPPVRRLAVIERQVVAEGSARDPDLVATLEPRRLG